mmetsp:Transcript_12635/g.31057  ORF Transcript_12635/g.31057 Transcript_12635/m.31057 type:complete len:512 (+) Transcript_12635:93-1628(+)
MKAPKELTKEEVSQHNTPTDCWIIVNDYVYDITEFLTEHPGGYQALMAYAGEDATSSFLDIHDESYLASFLKPSCLKGKIKGVPSSPPSPLEASSSSPKPKKLMDPKGSDIVSLPRRVYSSEHEAYRTRVRAWLHSKLIPEYDRYSREGCIPREVYQDAYKNGFYCMAIPKEYGGHGLTDFRYSAIVCEEVEMAEASGFFANLGSDMVLPYFLKQMNAEQKKKFLPDIAAHGRVLAVAMSEPEVGSDLGALSTRAVDCKGGFEISGRKMWISAGSVADYIVVAAVTDPAKGSKGISLFLVEATREGFAAAKRVKKIGKLASDTCLLTFEKVWVPAENMIGKRGDGFKILMSNLAKERLSIALGAAAAARRILACTTNYVHGRAAFGANIGRLQYIQMTLAKLRAEIDTVTAYVDQCILDQVKETLTAETAAVAKLMATELSNRAANTCLQFFGGYGYLKGCPVAKQFLDQRVAKIYGGANEVMAEIIGKGLGFKSQRFHSKRRPAIVKSKL